MMMISPSSLLISAEQQTGSRDERAIAAACVPWRGSPATAGKCDHVMSAVVPPSLPNNVLLIGQSYEATDKAAANKTVLMGAFFPPVCRNPLLALTCMGNFLHCRFSTVPQFDVCEAVVLGCTAFFESQGTLDQLPDCDQIDNSTGTPLPAFPPDGTQCLSVPSDLCTTSPKLFIHGDLNDHLVPYTQADCPYPLKYNYDGESSFAENGYNGQDMCVMPCPNPMWSDAEWTGGITIMMIVGGCSFILAAFMVITLCLMPAKRRYPGSLFIYIISCSMVVSFVVVFFPLVSGGPTRMVCTHGSPPVEVTFDNAREHDGGGVPCVLQGMGILFFGLAANFWWLALCINVFEGIRRFHLFFHIVAWGLPTIAVIICLAGTTFGALPAIPYCFVAGNEWWAWTVFYFPIGITLIVGSILMVAAVGRMIKIRFRIRRGTTTGQTIEQVVRLLLLIVAYWLILTYPWAFRIYTRVIEDDIADAVEAQIRCSVATGQECGLDTRINIGSWYLMLIDLSCHGFVLFGCLCSTETIRFWVQIHKIMYTKPFRDAIAEVKDMISGSGDDGWSKSTVSRQSKRSSMMASRSQVSADTRSASIEQDGDEEGL
ncbi:Frizzled/Smoothened family membrane region protein [Acanthamoeba castellanii str. Neff]|uniref:Frizzled/Smoothened family membrane region protein n=1 Tax=Acanthamoeba castellanii (strain ATCC 30010 / Neff) TaxID=1257118 RepID=L8H134_ACACF|nr:Frizzled/Smoothened family membrane region protein [Acanthamoeba castellanii str. Neff]ELR18066.1 Frizzled/Smoothened family membrane region protein [Acanthamoeba castellanii str. Neff]